MLTEHFSHLCWETPGVLTTVCVCVCAYTCMFVCILPSGERGHSEWWKLLSPRDRCAAGLLRCPGKVWRLQQRHSQAWLPGLWPATATKVQYIPKHPVKFVKKSLVVMWKVSSNIVNGLVSFYSSYNYFLCACACVSCRVLEQHKLTKEQWEDRIQTWHEEHRSMLRWVRHCLCVCERCEKSLDNCVFQFLTPECLCLCVLYLYLCLQGGCDDGVSEDCSGPGDVRCELLWN